MRSTILRVGGARLGRKGGAAPCRPAGSTVQEAQDAMKTITANILSEQTKHAVVQLPEAQYPGSLIQGDWLAMLCAEAREVSELLKKMSGADEDLLFLAQGHQEKLLQCLLHYQKVLGENNITLPYGKPAQPGDLIKLID